MERLTTRIAGAAVMAYEHEEQHTTDEWIDMLQDRLAAYEDMGYSPEEFAALCREAAKLRMAAGVKTIEELRVLAQGGRLVILPCKAGDKIWRIVDMASHTAYKNYVREETVRPFGVPYRDITGGISLIPLDAFGKTVFFTQEEAEAALEGGGSK